MHSGLKQEEPKGSGALGQYFFVKCVLIFLVCHRAQLKLQNLTQSGAKQAKET